MYFAVFAVIITAGAFFLDGFYTKGKDFLGQGLRALVTLGIGLSFYVTLSAYIQNRSTLRKFLLFLYIAGIWLILWSFVEFYLLRTRGSTANFPDWITNFRAIFAFQKEGLKYTNRLSGFAYEPSWYVLMFDLVLLPIWFSSVFQRKSLFALQTVAVPDRRYSAFAGFDQFRVQLSKNWAARPGCDAGLSELPGN